jgi:putative hemolysin
MSSAEIGFVILAAVAAVVAAMLAATEAAFIRMSTARADSLVEDERRGATTLRSLLGRRDEVLMPVLLVRLACQIGVVTAAATLARRWWGADAVLWTAVGVLGVLYVVTEALPKALALRHVDSIALRTAPVARLLWMIVPLRWLGAALASFVGERTESSDGSAPSNGVSEEELLALAEEAAASDAIDSAERELIESIIEFGDTIARNIMVPRPDMVVVQKDFRVVDAIEVVILNGYSRVPACGEGIDDVVGVVHAKDLMRADRDGRGEELVDTLLRPVRFVPETKRIAPLLREMQAEKFHLAVVVDEYGGTAGLITLEDLLEELVGEIVDEFDVEQSMIEDLGDGSFRVNGKVARYDFEELIGSDLPEGDWDTVGGLVFTTLGHVPRVGESVRVGSHELVVERVHGRRIARVRVTPAVPADEHAAAEPVA